MIVSSRGSRCVRCAYRAQLRTLQQRRCGSTVAGEWQPSPEKTNLFRRTGGPRAGDDQRGARITYHAKREGKESAKSSRENIVRKFVQQDADLSKWGIGREGGKMGNREQSFRTALQETLAKVREDVKEAPVLSQVAKDQRELDGKSGREFSFERLWKLFTSKVMSGSSGNTFLVSDERSLFDDLARVFRERGKSGLEDRVKYSFYGHVTGARFTTSDIRNQKTMADLRYPTEWFPATRQLHRTIHLHVGPTNSGKTYHALQRLEQAETGAYAGPLRLLAHEVFSRLNAKGKPCALVTGEERRLPMGYQPGAEFDGAYNMTACTVEMMPLNRSLDVAVIDEIQMIGNADRGWAWTQALLGVMAKEVHLCGEERTVPLIKELCASVGEKLEIHRYQRLSPLAVQDSSLDGDLTKLRKGDCIVSFSVMGIHALRKQIEKSTGRKVATVYGSLPPETRAQQARLFNDPNNDYDYLVASDAVGMGLNLAIKRIIFESSSKFNGVSRQTLNIADIKQIGGRAGRFRIAEQGKEGAASAEELAAAKGDTDPDAAAATPKADETLGLVTTLERFDFPIVRAAMGAEPEPIKSAGLFPPAPILERFAGYFPPGTPFSYILTRLHELSQMHSRFHLCGLKDQVWIADLIEGVEGLSVADRNILCSCPAAKSDTDMWKTLMPAYAKCIATQSEGNIAEIKELPLEIMEAEVQGTREYLRELERLHKGVVAYLWLSYRFAGIFSTRNLAFHVKGLVEERIEKTLSQFSFSEAQRRKLAALREQALLKNLAQESEDLEEQQANQVQHLGTAAAAANAALGGTASENQDKLHPLSTKASEQDNDNSFDLGAHLDGLGEQPPTLDHRNLEKQTSQLAGGDHFGGATEDVELEEPGLEPDGIDKSAATPMEEIGASNNIGKKHDSATN
ncbi:Putative helicase, P-loop containing nucleoside triphosphate hydrolase, suv3 domain 1 [Septoria linicola]|uniref:RNA helicase n=1 Tax=Septoria linicola TaxID=215465 RepID=A0A9Q9B2Q0_9PEZI|nr:putative helicase, P-loop containing nucleoside triphosphate hydrolase, suv3 domain 1 [Septoria linicola]USW57100.1 Putative helicase, P-loop containing nucleoside triphosphate hydrolase, suv3 domain 1 [Septoria linicola]